MNPRKYHPNPVSLPSPSLPDRSPRPPHPCPLDAPAPSPPPGPTRFAALPTPAHLPLMTWPVPWDRARVSQLTLARLLVLTALLASPRMSTATRRQPRGSPRAQQVRHLLRELNVSTPAARSLSQIAEGVRGDLDWDAAWRRIHYKYVKEVQVRLLPLKRKTLYLSRFRVCGFWIVHHRWTGPGGPGAPAPLHCNIHGSGFRAFEYGDTLLADMPKTDISAVLVTN